jgi:hypothetical protein
MFRQFSISIKAKESSMELSQSNTRTILDLDPNGACWVVRPGKDYEYYKHFLSGSFAAIGHLDNNLNENFIIDKLNFDKVANKYYKERAKEGDSKSKISANINQARRFLFDMKVGDLIFTIGENRIVSGVITSEAYIDDVDYSIEDIYKTDETTLKNTSMPYKIRRDIQWGKSHPRDDIPLAVKKSFKANQAVFSATEHLKSIYHWLNAVFIIDGVVYSSAKIKQTEDIHHYSVTQFADALNKIEALSTLIEESYLGKEINNITLEMVEKRLNELAFDDSLKLTTQQLFMSPGDYWTGFGSEKRIAIVAFTLGVCSLFGIQPVFANEHDEALAKHIKPNVSNIVSEVSSRNNMELAKDNLKLDIPEQDIIVVKKLSQKPRIPRVGDSENGVR